METFASLKACIRFTEALELLSGVFINLCCHFFFLLTTFHLHALENTIKPKLTPCDGDFW